MISEFDSILIVETASIKDAMRQLDKTAEKILFVIDGRNHLVGSLTDGDIRRWILAGGTLDENVSKACFSGTYSVTRNYEIESVKEEILRRGIVYVPVVDENNTITEFLIWDKLFDGTLKRKTKEKLDIPVMIMAGGKGTRLEPFTRILPKPLIPIGDKPVIELIIDRFVEFDVQNFFISVNHKSRMIKAYFEELNPPYQIHYIDEDKPLGTAGSLKQLERDITGSIVVSNCDVIINYDYSRILTFHRESQADITLVAATRYYRVPYGICAIDNGGILKGILEKPEYDFLVNTGMYFLESRVFSYIPTETMFHMTDLVSAVKQHGGKVAVFPVSEKSWIDVGEWTEYKRALQLLSQ